MHWRFFKNTDVCDSGESSTSDDGDRCKRPDRNLAHARTIDYMSVHANGDESVEGITVAPWTTITAGYRQATNRQFCLKIIIYELLDEDEAKGPAIQRQLTEIAEKRWGTRLTSEKIKKYD